MFKDGVPELPGGDGRLSFFKRCVWWAIWGGRFPFGNTDTVKIEHIGGKYYFTAGKAAAVSAAGLWPWMHDTHRELDPTLKYTKGKCAYVSPENPLCTVGLTDLDTHENVKATAGIWLALQDVPAKTGAGYNVPQDPMPSIGGTVSGTPLTGDADAAESYWILVKPTC